MRRLTIMDKIQGTIEKLTNDDTRMNTAEVTALQQSFYNLQLGLVKIEFFLTQTQNPEVRGILTELRDEFVKPNLEKPTRILGKAQIPFYNVDVNTRVQNMPRNNVQTFFTTEEILLDTVYSMQAVIAGMQAGALVAVRGDVRDFFLNARDAAFDQWRKVGLVTYKLIPQVLPPTITGVSTSTSTSTPGR
ncbi:MAG TPA: hypothetical protein VM370_00645 [Candidatus Thermoplasmatota archaeon]|nr:hypothetical protein [Candidatus Thermoplasmatota archaeon]